jgi:hypothetical protein
MLTVLGPQDAFDVHIQLDHQENGAESILSIGQVQVKE